MHDFCITLPNIVKMTFFVKGWTCLCNAVQKIPATCCDRDFSNPKQFYFFFVFLVSSHSSKVMLRSTTPFGVSSKTRFATV